MKEFFKKKGYKGIILSILMSLIFISLFYVNNNSNIDSFLMDLIYQNEKIEESNIIIINTKKDYSFNDYINLIDDLENKNVKIIGILDDINYDINLDNKLNNYNNIILSNKLLINNLDYRQNEIHINEALITNNNYNYNYKYGYKLYQKDKDNVLRKTLFNTSINDIKYNSFSYMIYKLNQEIDNLDIKEYKENEFYNYKYYIKKSNIINLNIDNLGDVDLNNKIILLNNNTDTYENPLERIRLYNEAEIEANIILSLLNDGILYDYNYYLVLVLVFVFILLFSYFIYKIKLLIQSIITLISLILIILIMSLSYNFGLYLPLFNLTFIVILIYLSNITFNYVLMSKEKNETINIFSKYVSKDIAKNALNNDIKIEGIKKDIACIFIDIRGFTAISEKLDPALVVEILNKYLEITTDSILSFGGIVDKYIGDATMGLFNAPNDLEDYEFKAILTALLIKEKSQILEKEFYQKYKIKIAFGIGINSGFATIGNIGSKDKIEYTAIGDMINIASRLEGIAKAREILITKEMYLKIKDKIKVKKIGDIKLKGKEKTTTVYHVIGLKES